MSKIKLKRSSTQGKVPLVADLEIGEIAINTFDGKLFVRTDNGAPGVVEIGASSTIDAYTKAEADTLLAGKSSTSHNHALSTLTDTQIESPATNNFLKFDGTKWVASALPTPVLPYDVAFYLPTNPYTLTSIVSGYVSPRAISVAPTGNHIARCSTVGISESTVFEIKLNATLVATVTFPASATSGTITFTNGAFNVVSGDALTLWTKDVVDIALAGIGITLVGLSSAA